jgi:hypothetical protein
MDQRIVTLDAVLWIGNAMMPIRIRLSILQPIQILILAQVFLHMMENQEFFLLLTQQ